MKDPKIHPPKWADHFLNWFCSEHLIEEIQGDLHEAFHYRSKTYGYRKATRMYIADVFRFFKPYAFEKYSRAKQFLPMFDNYFKIALRNIFHRKSFTAINTLGLSVGISAIMLIGIFLHSEFTYDQSVPEHEQVYRLMNHYRDQVYSNMPFRDYYQSPRETQLTLINRLRDYDEVKQSCHFVPSQSDIGGGDKYYVRVDGQRYVAEHVLFTNTGPAFQEIFPQKFLMGNGDAAFSGFQKIILTEKLAKRWFGKNWQQKDLVGKELQIEEEIFELSGVVANVPENVHYDFDWIALQKEIPSWGAYTYLKLHPNASINSLMAQLNQEVDKVYPGYTEDVLSKGIVHVPLTQIHFTDNTLYEIKAIANKTYLFTFGIVGVLILLIILTNYTNLSLAMYADRQKELGVRKVLGAQPRDISLQLLTEAVLLALICFPICLVLLSLSAPAFLDLMGINENAISVFEFPYMISLLLLLLLTGFCSGIYPALAYSRRPMLRLFQGKLNKIMGKQLFNFRNLLITGQFIMVIGMLSLTYFIYQQMNFIENKDLGYQKEGVLYFGVDGAEKYKQLRPLLEAIPEVEAVGANGLPGAEMFNQVTYKMQNTDLILSDGTQEYLTLGSIEALKINCGACTYLESGKERIFVINQTAAEKLAKIKGVQTEELIGETLITEPEWENEEFGNGIPHVIDGIIEDFKYFSLKYPNQSLLIDVLAQPSYVYTAILSAKTDNWTGTIQEIEQAYNQVEEVRPFDFAFLEDRLSKLYENESRSGSLMAGLSIIAIVLSLMGLAGIVSYIALGRQKEIGIRKVLGASVNQILLSFNKEFILLMGLATLIAIPIAIYFSQQWLDSFAFSIQPQFWVVLFAGLIALILVVVLVSIQSIRAANKQPVEVLRMD